MKEDTVSKVLAVLGIVAVSLLGVSAPAFATGGQETQEDCVPSDAYTETIPGSDAVESVYETVIVTEAGWQRYSYTGAYKEVGAPPFPGDNWQANTASDPHKVGVEGAYFIDKGNQGLGDWFYLQAVAEVTEQRLVTEAVSEVLESYIEHPAVFCDPEPTDVCVNIEGVQETIPEGLEAGPATEAGPTCVEADSPCPGLVAPECVPVDVPPTTTPPVVDAPVETVSGVEELAYTGSNNGLFLLGGLGMLGVGATLMLRRFSV
jgi:LPXTG-motif cell wall-anchored protein